MPIGKKSRKIKNAQQCGHWKRIDKKSKCAAMFPLEKKLEKFKMRSNVAIGKKMTKIKNAQQCAHWKNI